MDREGDLELYGVSLETYAGVVAARAEGIELGAILAQERIVQPNWEQAERAWREAIVAGPDLQVILIQKRRIAEDCLRRDVPPLDGEVAAWAGMLTAMALAPDPKGFVSGLGITMSDIARLGRSWQKKAAEDPDVAKQLGELAQTAPPPTGVKPRPMKLQRFPWSPAAPKEAPLPPKPDPVDAGPIPTAAVAQDGAPVRQLASYQLKAPVEPPRAPAMAPVIAPVAIALQPPQAAPPPVLAATVVGDATAIAPAHPRLSPAVPFQKAPERPSPAPSNATADPPSGTRELTIDQYAWVVAKMRRTRADDRNAALEQLRMTEASYTDLNLRWDAKIEAEPALGQAFAVALVRQMAALKPAEEAPKPAPQPIGDETAAIDVASIRSAIPFLAEKAPIPQAPKPTSVLTAGTVLLNDGEMFGQKGPQLPFAVPDPHAPRPSPARSIPIVEAPRRRNDQLNATLPTTGDAGLVAPTPFKGSEDELMPLAQYASISAVLIREGNPDATFRRLGIDPVAWLKTVRGYAKRMGEDRALAQEFERLMQSGSKPPR